MKQKKNKRRKKNDSRYFVLSPEYRLAKYPNKDENILLPPPHTIGYCQPFQFVYWLLLLNFVLGHSFEFTFFFSLGFLVWVSDLHTLHHYHSNRSYINWGRVFVGERELTKLIGRVFYRAYTGVHKLNFIVFYGSKLHYEFLLVSKTFLRLCQ